MGGWVGPLAFVEWETRGHQTGTVPMQRSLLKAGCVIRPCKCSNMGTNYTETQAPADKAALCCSWENDSREGRDRADAELAAELSTLEFLSCLQKGGIIYKNLFWPPTSTLPLSPDPLFGKLLLEEGKDKSAYIKKITWNSGSRQGIRGEQSSNFSANLVKWCDMIY